MQSDTTAVFIVNLFLKSNYNSYTWPKNTALAVSKVILSGMDNCNFEAIN